MDRGSIDGQSAISLNLIGVQSLGVDGSAAFDNGRAFHGGLYGSTGLGGAFYFLLNDGVDDFPLCLLLCADHDFVFLTCVQIDHMDVAICIVIVVNDGLLKVAESFGSMQAQTCGDVEGVLAGNGSHEGVGVEVAVVIGGLNIEDLAFDGLDHVVALRGASFQSQIDSHLTNLAQEVGGASMLNLQGDGLASFHLDSALVLSSKTHAVNGNSEPRSGVICASKSFCDGLVGHALGALVCQLGELKGQSASFGSDVGLLQNASIGFHGQNVVAQNQVASGSLGLDGDFGLFLSSLVQLVELDQASAVGVGSIGCKTHVVVGAGAKTVAAQVTGAVAQSVTVACIGGSLNNAPNLSGLQRIGLGDLVASACVVQVLAFCNALDVETALASDQFPHSGSIVSGNGVAFDGQVYATLTFRGRVLGGHECGISAIGHSLSTDTINQVSAFGNISGSNLSKGLGFGFLSCENCGDHGKYHCQNDQPT